MLSSNQVFQVFLCEILRETSVSLESGSERVVRLKVVSVVKFLKSEDPM